MTYSADLRSRVLGLVDEGKSPKDVAALFKVSRATIFLWKKQPVAYVNGKPGPKTARCIDRQKLCDLVQAEPDLMIKELAQRLSSKRSTVHANLQVLRLRRKKNTAIQSSLQRSESADSKSVSKAPTSGAKQGKPAGLFG